MSDFTVPLSAAKVTLERNGVRILDDVGLEVPAGRFTAIIGPNGAGKSSLLGVISGLCAPTAGSVHLFGRDIRAFSPAERARLCAVMRQDNFRPAGLTVLESVELGRVSTGAAETRNMAWALVEKYGLKQIAHRDCAYLSGGEWQRAAFARTMLQIQDGSPPGVLLLDEPVSNLDPFHQHGLLTEARQLARKGHAVLAVLHDLNLTRRYADFVVMLKSARVATAGPAREQMQPDTLGALYDCPVARLVEPSGSVDALVTLPPNAPQ